MQVKSFHAASIQGVTDALVQARAGGFAPTLGIVFTSVSHDLAAVRAAFGQGDAGLQIFGATSAGGIEASAAGGDCVFEQSIVASLLQLDRAAFRVKLFDGVGRDPVDVGREVGEWARLVIANPALMIAASGLRTDGEQLVRGILGVTGPDAPIFGGLAGDDLQFKDTQVFSNDGASPQGVLALAFDRDLIEVRGVAASGWRAVGGEKVITSSTGNVVHTIDGAPALDVYKEYLGVTSDTDIIIPEYPLQIMKDGYAVMRAALLTDPATRSLVYAGTVPQGARVRFSTSPGVEITEAALHEMRLLHETTESADALVLFSCKGRHMALGPMAEDEIRPMQQLWGKPLVGLFAYGEIGPLASGHCDFHNETCVLVTLRER